MYFNSNIIHLKLGKKFCSILNVDHLIFDVEQIANISDAMWLIPLVFEEDMDILGP